MWVIIAEIQGIPKGHKLFLATVIPEHKSTVTFTFMLTSKLMCCSNAQYQFWVCLNFDLILFLLLFFYFLDEEWGSIVPALAQRKEHILLFQTTAIQGEVTLHIHGLPSYASCVGFRVPQLVPLENRCHRNHICTNRRSAKTGVGSVTERPTVQALLLTVMHQIISVGASL